MNDDCQLLADFFDVLLISLVWLCVCEILESVGCDFVSDGHSVKSLKNRCCLCDLQASSALFVD
jgi:hypothetical protein